MASGKATKVASRNEPTSARLALAQAAITSGHIRHVSHGGLADRIVRHQEVDALHQIEAASVPEPGQDAHADELEIVFAERERQDDEVDQHQADRPDDERLFSARQPHENLMTEEQAAACEIARIARDLAARGGVL